jgi:transcriptional regulator with XRE-family HTH domain
VDDVRLGLAFRSVRLRFGWRQIDVAAKAGVSHQVVSRIERGHPEEVSIRAVRAVATALGIRLDLVPRWRGGELDRLVSGRHAAMHETVITLFDSLPGWEIISEVSYSIYGERGVIDLIGWHAAERALLIGELKSEFVDPNELVGSMDRRKRLAATIVRERGWIPKTVSVWVLADDQRTNHRQLARHARLLRGAFPADGRSMRRWLRSPSTAIAALSFLPGVRHTRARHRVRASPTLDPDTASGPRAT